MEEPKKVSEAEFARAREEIASIDEKIAALFEERMLKSGLIADYKAERGLPVRDPLRERELTERNAERIKDNRVREVYPAVEEAVMAASRRLQEDRRHPGSFVSAGGRVHFCRDGAGKLSDFFDTDRKTMIVTDSGVPEKWVSLVASQLPRHELFRFSAGEASKSPETLKNLLNALTEKGFTRSDTLLALGGGVVTDLTAFAAGIWLRGVTCRSIPTTLLAQADAAVGGKNGIDFGGVKNSVGLFRAPETTLIDPAFLETLDDRQTANGTAEIVKIALALDAPLFAALEETGGKVTDGILLRAVGLKREIVGKDERETSGARRVLNFGHTLGHGIEIAAGGRLLHGEAVALGMLPMTAEGTRKRLTALYEKIGLPLSAEYDPETAFAAMKHDKKAGEEGVTCVTVGEPGEYAFRTLDEAALKRLAYGEAVLQ